MDLLKLSVSKTKTFKDCKKKFKFVYVDKLPRKDWEHHTFGKFCHKALEDFHKHYMDGGQMAPHILMTECFKAAKEEFKSQVNEQLLKDCRNILIEYLKLFSKQKSLNNDPKIIGVEHPFNFNISENVILNGMIDRVQIDVDNILHVADYKTTKNKKYLKNDWFQLLTYAYVMIQEKPDLKKIRASYILLRHDFEYITTEFDVDEILKVKDEYLQYAENIIKETDYKANPTTLCAWCDHLDICTEGLAKTGKNKFIKTGETDW